MKNLALTLFFILFSIVSYAQTQYPIIKEDANGNKVIVMTIEQANTLASKAELLWLYEQYFENRIDIDQLVLEIIDNQNQIISHQDILISELKAYVNSKDQKIEILTKQLELQTKLPVVSEKIVVKDNATEKKLKRSRIISAGLVVAIIILLF